MTQETSQLWGVIADWMKDIPYPPTQAKFAKRVGVTGNAVSDWKYGHSRPTPENLERIAEELEPVVGPTVRKLLLDAVNRDLGYNPERASRDAAAS